MERETFESIITSIEEGDSGQALKIAKSALERMALHTDMLEDQTSDHSIPQLFIDDAKNMVSRAIMFCKNAGKEVALAEVSNRDGFFVEGQQYVFVLDESGMMLAHGINQRYVGRDFLWVKDFDGKAFVKEIVEMAKNDGYGVVEYKWINPVSSKGEPKMVYFEKYEGMIFCSGIYGPETL
jgi:signal transduction histidine kinase